MSKDRARRRLEREVLEAGERERRRREVERAAASRRRRARLSSPFIAVRAARRRRRTDSLLARQRRRENRVLLGLLFCVHVALWLFTDSWLWRGSALVLTAMAWPVLVTVLFDRRSST